MLPGQIMGYQKIPQTSWILSSQWEVWEGSPCLLWSTAGEGTSSTQTHRCYQVLILPRMFFCSAGIGRTGVLITMETAMTLMEKEKPVYPLEIITFMREQRAMLVQTSVQTHTQTFHKVKVEMSLISHQQTVFQKFPIFSLLTNW